eukprot:g16954.t1
MNEAPLDEKSHITRDGIRIYQEVDFSGMHKAGALAARILDEIAEHVVPGQTTGELDRIIEEKVNAAGATSATIGYKGYQHASCISINHVVCHGIPGDKKLKDGDILNIDVTVIVDGWYGDTSRMYVAGKLSRKSERLIQVTHDSLMKGIEAVRPGATFGDIGHAIQTYVEANRMSVVRDFCGHGLGRSSTPRRTCCTMAAPAQVLADDWTAVTRDKSLSAQFEHSVGVTADGVEIFTLSPGDMFHPTYS